MRFQWLLRSVESYETPYTYRVVDTHTLLELEAKSRYNSGRIDHHVSRVNETEERETPAWRNNRRSAAREGRGCFFHEPVIPMDFFLPVLI
jgi:hypothetical protein